MRHLGWGVLVFAPFMASAALADCPAGTFTVTPTPDNTAYSILFSDMVSTIGAPAHCALSVPTALPAGTVAVYSATYKGGYADPDATASLSVAHNGVTDSAVLPDGFTYDHLIGSSNLQTIDSDITFELLTGDPAGDGSLDTLDYLELARATTADLQASADQLAAARTGIVTQLNGTVDLLSGAGQPIDAPDGVAFVGGVGSVTLGAEGHYALGNGFTVLGGIAYLDQTTTGAETNGIMGTAGLRYVAPEESMFRPLAEVGLQAAPALGFTFSRTYLTGGGTVSASGTTTGAFYGAYARAGVLIAPDPNNTIVFSGSFARDWLSTAAYSETMTGTNLFAASAPAQTATYDVARLGVDWTTRITPEVALTFSGAVGHTFAETAVTTTVAFAGPFASTPVDESFVEYGARASYDIAPQSTVGAFVYGTTGQVSGTHVQVGADFHVRF